MRDWDELSDDEKISWLETALIEREKARLAIKHCESIKSEFEDEEDAFYSCIDRYRNEGMMPSLEDLSRYGLRRKNRKEID